MIIIHKRKHVRSQESHESTQENFFCQCFSDSIFRKFSIEVEVFVSKKNKIVYIAFEKALMPYSFFDEIISFIEQYWSRRKLFSRLLSCVSPHESKSEVEKRLHFFIE